MTDQPQPHDQPPTTYFPTILATELRETGPHRHAVLSVSAPEEYRLVYRVPPAGEWPQTIAEQVGCRYLADIAEAAGVAWRERTVGELLSDLVGRRVAMTLHPVPLPEGGVYNRPSFAPVGPRAVA